MSLKPKAEAAKEMAVASGVEYKIYPSSEIMNSHILKYLEYNAEKNKYSEYHEQGNILMVAEETKQYGKK